jgi:hypothetical protein
MSYKEDNQKHIDECKAAHALWEVWQKSKKDEDKDIWWAALTGIKSKKYLTIQLTIWPGDEVDADRIKEMIESNGTNLPWNGENLYHGDKVIGEIMSARASTWPKPAM